MNIVAVMTHATRPAYSRQSLAALMAARAGRDLADFACFVEPTSDEVRALVREATRRVDGPTCLIENPGRLGCNGNTVQALDWAFDEAAADMAILVEDDIIASLDFLDYFAWAAERFRDDSTIASVTAYNRLPAMPPATQWHAAETRSFFHGWGWGTWRDRWPTLRAAIPARAAYTWDTYVCRSIVSRGLREVFPTLSRSDNIGLVSSVHPELYPPSFYEQHHKLRVHAGMVDVPPGEWRLVE